MGIRCPVPDDLQFREETNYKYTIEIPSTSGAAIP